ncbi:glycosyltransferase family 4 protein [Candidatus Gottesmanbacteria bacterium]|nr:glycosyltransferase family 4 protein [Candidatus Gottesmanbacteria bacterium]
MKIGIDGRLYFETGVGRYIRNLLKEYDGFDDSNEYIVFTTPKAVNQINSYSRMKAVATDIRWHSIEEQISFPLLLNRFDLDLIHFPYFSVPLFNSHPFVVTIHDLTTLNYSTGKASTLPLPLYKLKHIAYRFVLKNALFNSKRIIVPSNSVKKDLIKVYPQIENKIRVTYEAGSLPMSDSQRQYSFEPFFLYVGNSYPHKNLENAILALKLFNSDRKNKYNLVIAGKIDHFTQRLKDFAKTHKVDKQIIFQNSLNDQALSRLYLRCEGLIFPSLSEGFGLPILEAFDHGTIVCCSNIEVFRELYGSVPFYFNPLNIESIAKSMEKTSFLNAADKKKIIKEQKEISSKFSWKKTASKTLEIYKEAMR